MHVVLGLPVFGKLRPRATEGLAGRVLEIGFGSGLNLPCYPREVREVLALEPSDVARRLARPLLERAPFPVRFVGLRGEEIPLEDESVDAVLSTWTLCTIPDLTRALAELRRVLRPGGRFPFRDHGLADEPRLAAGPRRLTPLQMRLAGGCRLDRPIRSLLTGSGLAIERLEHFSMRWPKTLGCFYEGRAIKA